MAQITDKTEFPKVMMRGLAGNGPYAIGHFMGAA